MFKKFMNDESGATAIEYGLIAALLAVVIVGTVTTVGSSLDQVFSSIDGGLKTGLANAGN